MAVDIPEVLFGTTDSVTPKVRAMARDILIGGEDFWLAFEETMRPVGADTVIAVEEPATPALFADAVHIYALPLALFEESVRIPGNPREAERTHERVEFPIVAALKSRPWSSLALLCGHISAWIQTDKMAKEYIRWVLDVWEQLHSEQLTLTFGLREPCSIWKGSIVLRRLCVALGLPRDAATTDLPENDLARLLDDYHVIDD
jgi:hypothetical protein